MPRVGTRTRDSITIPGDKSITHRALMFAALARGNSVVRLPLGSLDARSTAGVLRALGADISPVRDGATVRIRGNGVCRPPENTLQCGNSGTTARLMLGILAGRPFAARLTGDATLRRRPMRRVTEPLVAMGATVEGAGDRLPLTIRGGPLRPISWTSPVASAQVKSALLLAGVTAEVDVTIREPHPSRDHTERILRSFGYTVTSKEGGVEFVADGAVEPFEATIPGDPSSAAFLVAAATLGHQGEAVLAGVGVNPTRIGFLTALGRMGADISLESPREIAGEPVADLVVRPAQLTATTVTPDEVPSLVDEVPILACLAARAQGTSRFRGLAELRVKESDRLALLAENLTAVGVQARVDGDDLEVTGTDRPLGGRVRTAADHRIAMAFAVLSENGALEIDDPASAAVSFPGFAAALAAVRRRVA